MLQATTASTETGEYYCRKAIDSGTVLICKAGMQPIDGEDRCGYTFTLSLECGGEIDSAEVSDVTSDAKEAKRIFDLLCGGDVSPCHLADVVEDCIVYCE